MKAKFLNPQVLKKWMRIIQIVWLVLIGLAIILLITRHSFSFAAGGDLEEWVTNWSSQLGWLVGLLAVVMVIIAGIVYIFDLGGGKQIGVAKEMIISAISGVLLFMLAAWLLGQVNSLFPKQGYVEPTATDGGGMLAPMPVVPPAPTPGDEGIIPGGGEGLMPPPDDGSMPFPPDVEPPDL